MKRRSRSFTAGWAAFAFYFMSAYFAVMMYTGGTGSRPRMKLSIEPLTALQIAVLLFVIGSVFLAIAAVRKSNRKSREAEMARWRAKREQ